MLFKKMKTLCDLEERHSVDRGESYHNGHFCATFVEFNGADLRHQLRKDINKARFFSIQVDSSTDCGNIGEELFMVLFFDGLSEGYCKRQVFCCTTTLLWHRARPL